MDAYVALSRVEKIAGVLGKFSAECLALNDPKIGQSMPGC